MNNNPDKDELIRQLTEEKNNLLKIISHDIRSPFSQLFALMQMLEMESENLTGRQKEYMDKMYMAILGGTEMIKNLHDARSLDNGNITLNPEEFPIKKTIQRCIRNFTIQSRIKNIEVVYDELCPEQEVFADKVLFMKVLDIVLSNAIKYSDPGSQVHVNNSLESGKNILTIKDFGPGLPDDELRLIFKKFQKLSTKPTLGESTTGLGMFLAHEFMKMMGGNISAIKRGDAGLYVIIELNSKKQT